MISKFCRGRIAVYSDWDEMMAQKHYRNREGMKKTLTTYNKSYPDGFFIIVIPYMRKVKIVERRIYTPVLTGEVKEKIVREKTVNYGIYTRK